jgi:hypothetical protein
MKSHVKIEDYDSAELSNAEGALRTQGYRLVRKESEREVLPREYIKQEYRRSIKYFGEQRRWTLRWRVSRIFGKSGEIVESVLRIQENIFFLQRIPFPS